MRGLTEWFIEQTEHIPQRRARRYGGHDVAGGVLAGESELANGNNIDSLPIARLEGAGLAVRAFQHTWSRMAFGCSSKPSPLRCGSSQHVARSR
jgi:hypothetical protein